MRLSFYLYCRLKLEQFFGVCRKLSIKPLRGQTAATKSEQRSENNTRKKLKWQPLFLFAGFLFALLLGTGLFTSKPASAAGCGTATTSLNYRVKVIADISTSVQQSSIPNTDPVQTTDTETTPANGCKAATVTATQTATQVGGITQVQIGAKGSEKDYWQVTYETSGSSTFSFPDDGTNFPKVCDTVLSGASGGGCKTTAKGDFPSGISAVNVVTLTATTSTVGTSVGGATGSSGDSGAPTCESSGLSLSWLFCPLIVGLANAADSMYSVFIQPLLVTQPLVLNTTANDPTHTFEIWSEVRVYGDIFLLIALLVIVFGQSLGGGMVDAYTAKKVLPRLLIAAVVSNLSIYLVAIAVDVTNVLGGGIANLIEEPFRNTGTFHLSFTDASSTLGLGALAGGAIWGLTVGGAVILPMIQFVFLFFLIPALLILLAILATVLLRRALIIFLVFIAPLAFALYALPNTEQYFKKWWDLLVKTLLVYPLIALLFALGNVSSVVINASGKTSGLAQPLDDLLSIIALFVPLFLIPFAFRILGGVLGRVHELMSNGRKKAHGFVLGSEQNPNSLRNRTRGRVAGGVNRSRAQIYRSMKGSKRAPRTAALLFGGAIEKEAALNHEAKQRIGNTKDNGDDSILNAAASFLSDEDEINPKTRALTGRKVRKTLDGKTVNDADYRAARRLHPNLSDVQAVADYRSTKLNTTEEAMQFADNFGKMAKQRGLSAEETTGVYTGLSFARQNERGEFKYGAYTPTGPGGDYQFHAAGDAGSFGGDPKSGGGFVDFKDSRSGNYVKENYSKRGISQASGMFGSHFQALGDIKKHHLDVLNGAVPSTAAQQTHAKEQIQMISEMEETYNSGGYVDQQGNVVGGGLSYAAPETKAAFAKMYNIGRGASAGPGAVPVAGPGGTPMMISPHLQAAQANTAAGNTYEATHSPTPGNFAPGSRPYKP